MSDLNVYHMKHIESMQMLGYSQRTITDYRRYVEKFITYLKQSDIKTITDVTRDTLHQYQQSIYYRTKKRRYPIGNRQSKKIL
jgi:site-specific recombinase XerD